MLYLQVVVVLLFKVSLIAAALRKQLFTVLASELWWFTTFRSQMSIQGDLPNVVLTTEMADEFLRHRFDHILDNWKQQRELIAIK